MAINSQSVGTLLSYTTSSTPNPLTAGATDVLFTITATNTGTKDADKVTQIVIAIPVGSTPGNLVPSIMDVTLSGNPTDDWQYQPPNAQNQITLTGLALATNQSVSVTLVLSSVTVAGGPVTMNVQETGDGIDTSNGTLTIQGTLLSYVVSASPSPLTAGGSDVALTITVTNEVTNPDAAQVSHIQITIPVGEAGNNLVPEISDVKLQKAANNPTNTWKYQPPNASNQIILTGPVLKINQSFSVTLILSNVTGDPGVAIMNVQESGGSLYPNDGIISVSIFPEATVISGPIASPVNIINTGDGGTTTISWSVTADGLTDCQASLQYTSEGQINSPAIGLTGSYVTPNPITSTTIFTLNVTSAETGLNYQSQVAVSVEPPPPDISAFSGALNWNTGQDSFGVLNLNWATTPQLASIFQQYCTINNNVNCYAPNGTLSLDLGSDEVSSFYYTLTVVNGSGSKSSTLLLDWSALAPATVSTGAQAICQQLVCSPLTGYVYGSAVQSSPMLSVIQVGQNASVNNIALTYGGAVVAVSPETLTGVNDVLYMVGPDINVAQIQVIDNYSDVIVTNVNNWPAGLVVAETDLACLIGQTLAVACAAAPGQLQLVDTTTMTWSSCLDLSSSIAQITSLTALPNINGYLVGNNTGETASLIGGILGQSAITTMTIPSLPQGVFVSTDYNTAYVYDLGGNITSFPVGETPLPSSGTTIVLSQNPPTGVSYYLWSLLPAADGSGLIALVGPTAQQIAQVQAVIFALNPAAQSISPAVSYIPSSTIDLNGACMTRGWASLLICTPNGLLVLRPSTYDEE